MRIQNVPVQDLTQLLAKVHPTVPELVQTTADRLHAQGEAVGEARGVLRGRAQAVVQVLESRGVELGDADRERILASRDEAELDRWLRQAVVIAAVTDLFVAND